MLFIALQEKDDISGNSKHFGCIGSILKRPCFLIFFIFQRIYTQGTYHKTVLVSPINKFTNKIMFLFVSMNNNLGDSEEGWVGEGDKQ